MLKTSSSLFVRATLTVALGLAASAASAAAPSATNGATLYGNKTCSNCHGTAPFAVNLSNIQNGVTASNTKNAAYGLLGKGGGQMNSHQAGAGALALTDSDYDDLAAYIAQQAGGTATCTSTGVPTAAAPATTVACGTTAVTPTPTPAATSSGGGCTIGTANQPFDPLWMLMLGGAALVWRRRASR